MGFNAIDLLLYRRFFVVEKVSIHNPSLLLALRYVHRHTQAKINLYLGLSIFVIVCRSIAVTNMWWTIDW